MKKRNTLRLRKALALFSVVVITFTHGMPAYAGVAESVATEEISEQIEEVQEPEVQPDATEESVAEPPAPVAPVEPSQPEVVDTTQVSQLLTQVNQIIANESSYTSASFAAAKPQLLAAQASAQALLANPQATTAEVTQVVEQLQASFAGLILKSDKTALNQLIQASGSYQAATYTAATFAVFQTALTQAKTVAENENATEAEVAQALTALQQAIAQLKKAEQAKPTPKPEPEKPQKPVTTQPAKPAETKPKETTPEKQPETTPNQGPVQESSTGETVSLEDRLVTDSLTDSDLNGFELPLLSSYEDERQAAIVSEALKQLSLPYEKNAKGPKAFDNLHVPIYVYQQVFGTDLGKDYQDLATSGKKVELAKAQPGDLLFWNKDNQVIQTAIYLGSGKYLLADETSLEERQQNSEEETEEIPGVRIYSLQGYDLETGEIKEDAAEDTVATTSQRVNPDFAVQASADLKLTDYGQKLIDTYAASTDFRANPTTQHFIDAIAEDARELGLKYDVFASVMIAQAILESGSGGSTLSTAPYYNLFGIKGSNSGSSVTMPTMEDDGSGNLYQINAAFRSYAGYKDSLTDYVRLIRGGISGNLGFYKDVWRSEAKNYLQATEALTGKYATDTSYNNKLNSIIAAYNLTQFDEPKAEAAGVILQSKTEIPAYYREKMTFPDYNGRDYNTSGSYPVGQCTWYVFNRITQLGGRVDDFMGNGGEWGQKGARLGYQTTQTPTVGYAVSFHPGIAGSSSLYGHVAFVEAVGPDGILVSEGNVVGPTTISYRVIPNSIARSANVTYVAPK
ncbi:glucosaminidase domain-containing protein [Enterococcus songbeiensis]